MNLIVVVNNNWSIGEKGDLLYKLPKDMARFRAITTGKTVVIGANTLLSFPKSQPLKNRKNIVLSIDEIEGNGATVVRTLSQLAKEIEKEQGEVYVCGGGMLYKTLYPYCEFAYVTKVDDDKSAFVKFDNLDLLENWSVIEQSEIVIDNGYKTKYVTYKNSNVKPLDDLA